MSTPRWGRALAVAFSLPASVFLSRAEAQSISTEPFTAVSTGSLTANWGTNFPGGTIYFTQLGTSPAFTGLLHIATTTASSASFTNLGPNTIYYARVSTGGTGPFSATATTATIPSTPSSLTIVTVGTGTVMFSWNTGGNPPDTQYRWSRSTMPSFSPEALGSWTLWNATAVVGGLSAFSTYHFRVQSLGRDSVPTTFSLGIATRTDPRAIEFAFSWGENPSNGAADVALGDLNGDGRLDMAVAISGGGSQNLIYFNDGSGRFSQSWTSPETVGSGAVALGDFDRDGDLDVAFANNSGPSARIYRNDGGGTFVPVWTSTHADASTNDLAWGDFNNDGLPDLATVRTFGPHRLYRNDGNDQFPIAWEYADSAAATSVAWGDYDADGYLDLLTGSNSSPNNYARVFRNASGGFAQSWASTQTGVAHTAKWADFDQDGAQDFATLNASSGGLLRVFRTSASTFSLSSAVSLSGDVEMALSDLDMDGDIDFVTSRTGSGGSQSHNAIQYSSSGLTAVWSSTHGYLSGSGVDLGDVDGDGRPDIAAVGRDCCSTAGHNSVRLYRNVAFRTNSPPSAPTGGFTATHSTTTGALVLTWSAGIDDWTPSAGLRYVVRAGTAPNGVSILSDAFTPTDGSWTHPDRSHANQLGRRISVSLSPGSTVYWSVRSIDASGLAGPLSAQQTFVLGGPPSLITTPLLPRSSASLSAAWITGFPNPETAYYVHLSTLSDFTVVAASATTSQSTVDFLGLAQNTTYYARVATTASGPYISFDPAATWIQTPSSLVFDEISSRTIVASAYAAAPGLTNLNAGVAGTNIARDGIYAGWQGEAWTTRAAMPTARYRLAAGVVNGKIYAIGGFDGTSPLTTIEEYDPVGNVWAVKSPMPTARSNLGAAELGGKLYVAGGQNGITRLTTLEEYDPLTDTWSSKAALPSARQGLVVVAASGRLFAIGGHDGTVPLDTTEEYIPATNGWIPRTPMPTARNAMGAAAVGGKIYVFGGENSSEALANTEAYDPASDSWEARSPIPTKRLWLAAGNVGGKIHAAGGMNGSDLDTVESYDPIADAWDARPAMPDRRMGLAAGTVGGKFFTVGGYQNSAPQAATSLYDPGVARQFNGLQPNTLYSFKAKARNLSGVDTSETGSVSTFTHSAIPAASGSPFLSVHFTSATVQWTANGNPGGTAYLVSASTSPSFSIGASSSSTGWTTNLSTAVTGLTADSTWFFRAQSRNTVFIPSAFLSIGSTLTGRFPPIPSVSVAAVGDSSATVVWTSTFPVGAAFHLQASSLPSFSSIVASTTTPQLTYSFFDLVPNTSYFIRIATDASGPWLQFPTAVTLASVPALPSLTVQSSGSLVALWAPNGNPADTAYQVVLATSSDFTLPVATVLTTSTTNVAFAGLFSNHPQFVRVRARGRTGQFSGYSQSGATVTAYAPIEFSMTWGAATNNYPEDASWGDYDGDGDLDMAVVYMGFSAGLNRIYRNDGGGSFSLVWSSTHSEPSSGAAWGDGDNDGDLDLAICNDNPGGAAPNVRVYRNSGAGAFDQVWISSHTDDCGEVHWGDYDNDGRPDLLSVNSNSFSPSRTRVYRNLGVLQFASSWSDPGASQFASGAWADFDSDGRLDIALGGSPMIKVFGNTASGFQQVFAATVSVWAQGLRALDFDSDGDPDIAVVGGNSLHMYRNDATTFTYSYAAPALIAGRLAVADLDGDGDLDILTHQLNTGANGAERAFQNDSSGFFQSVWISTPSGWGYGSVDLGDFDSDGWADVLAVGNGSQPSVPFVRALRSVTPGSNSPPSPPIGLTTGFDAARGRLRLQWNAPADDRTPTSLMTYVVRAGTTPGGASILSPATPPLQGRKLHPDRLSTVQLGRWVDVTLPFGTTVFWSVRAVDGQTALGPESAESQFVIQDSTMSSGQYSNVSTSALTFAWESSFSFGTLYYAQLSTNSSFAAPVTSSNTFALSAAFSGLTANTTYYAQVGTSAAGPFTALGSTVTLIQPPTSVYFDEVSTHSLVVSAYAPTPAFSNLGAGLSGTNVAKDGAYAGWRGERWTTKAAMSAARYAVKAAAVGGKIYAIGGYNGGNLATNAEYDPAADAWTAKTAMPTARHSFAVGVLNGKVYAMGGESTAVLATNQEYDPATNAWTTKASLPEPRTQIPTSVRGGRLHLFGGFTTQTVATHVVYDPDTNSWSSKASMATPRNAAAAATFGSDYVVGGATGTAALTVNEAYVPGSDSWVSLAPMPTARSIAFTGSVGGKMYVIGGEIGFHPGSEANEEYDPQADTWTARAPLPTPRRWGASATVKGKIYAIGGGNGTTLAVNEEYDPGVAHVFAGLQPNTQYAFKAKARNLSGLETAESASFSTYTWAAVPAAATPTFTAVFTSSVTAAWTANGNPGGTEYRLRASTAADFNGAASSVTGTWGTALTGAVSALGPNATWYFRVQARNAVGVETAWAALGSTATSVQPPTSIFFDEVSTHSLVVSAYAPTPAISNLGAGLSGTNVAKDGAYAGWRGERWTTKTAMTTARYGVRVAAANGRLYAIGGYNGGNLSTNAEYDPASNAWTAKTAMPTARHSFGIGTLNGKVYAVGGESTASLTVNQEYDPATDAWTTKAALATPRVQVPALAVDGKLHLLGGHNGTVVVGLHQAYNPLTDAWETKTGLPDARQGAGAGLVGGKAYLFGGEASSILAFNREFDFGTNAWVTKSTMPTGRGNLAYGVIGGKIYAVGGKIGAPPGTAATEEYDPAADAWAARTPSPTNREWLGGAVVAGRLYAIGGSNGTPLAVNEEYDPGVAHVFAGLQPNTQYAFKAKARNLNGLETAESASFSTYTWAAVPQAATPTFTGVFVSSVALSWTANGNPGGTEYRLHASTASNFDGGASSVTAGWMTALSTALSPLPPATWYFRVQARNAVGVETAFASLGSTRTRFADIPGCATSLFVQKAAGADCASIQACLGMVPPSLAGDACVVVNDSATYSESVVVQNKAPNGFRIRIFPAAGMSPVVTPPAGTTAGFRILNASVTVSGLAVVTTNTVTYGVWVSSPLVTLSSVSVDSGGKVSGAGIFLSSAGYVSYASVTVQNADGLRVTGSSNTIEFSTASVTAFSRAAFYLNGASSTTLRDSFGYGNPGYGAFLYHSHLNTLARNALRKVSATAGAAGLYLNDASSNTVSASFISNVGGTGLDLATLAHGNLVELSTVTAAGATYDGLVLGTGRGNRLSRVYVHSAGGNAGSLSSGASETLVEFSTFVSAAAGARALGTNGSSETLTGNHLYAPNGTALGLFGSSITVTLTTGTAENGSYPALYVAGGGYMSIRDSSFANAAGDGGKLERTSYVDILRSTVSGAGGGAGLKVEGASSNTVTASRLAAPGGVGLSVGLYFEAFDLTTVFSTGNVLSGLSISASTAVSVGAAPGLELSSSVLAGDVQGAALAFGDAVLVATFTGLAFPSGAAWSAEAALLPAGSRITVRDASGPQGGSLYENDPLSRVDWVPDLVPFILPSAPAAPSGTVLGASSISWTWGPVANAQSYRVYSSSSGSLLATSASTGAVTTGLLPASTHSVVVAGVARGENGPLSPSATAFTHATPPAGLALDQLYVSSAALSWSLEDNPSETLAELQRSTDGASYAVRAGTLAPSAVDSGLLGCTSYYYRVSHKSPAGVASPFDGPLLVRTAASTPAAPGDLSAQSVPGRRVALTWSGSLTEGIVAYRLYKDTGAGTVDYAAPYAEFGPTVFSTTTVALSSGAVHLFGLRAVHRCGVTETNTHAVASAWALESLDGVRAGIKVPATGKKISGNRVLVMAELDTGSPVDVSAILFQYRSTGSAAWTDIPAANANHPNPDREQPYFVHWDVTALADRAYDLRAVASDVLGASDPAPGSITVLVDSVGFEVRETDLGAGRVKKEQAVSNEATNTVAAAGSGSAVVTKVVLPAGALNTAGATLSATPNPAALPAPPTGGTSIGAAIEVTLSNGQSQLSNGQTAAIVFNYPDDDGDGVIDGTSVRAEDAQIQTFDVPTGTWKKEFATTLDKDKRTLTGQTPHFSLFAAFGVVQANLDSIRVYPNPYKPNGGNPDEGRTFSRADPLSGVVFDNLPAQVTVKIYTLTGRLVSEFGTSAGTGAVQWDGKNDQGEDVASGGYFAVITSPGAKPVIKKIGVIR